MKRAGLFPRLAGAVLACTAAFWTPTAVSAHCDGIDGPVVQAARKALETRAVNLALIWVQEKNEPEVRAAFDKTLTVRHLGPQARELADQYFFETLVRLHRAGEGAPYTGLKPAGRDLGPAIPAADRALADASLEPLEKLMSTAVEEGLRGRFQAALAKKGFDRNNVEAGREYVEAYVLFIHYVERLYEAARSVPHGHFSEPSPEDATHRHD